MQSVWRLSNDLFNFFLVLWIYFVVTGAFLDTFSIYDQIINRVGAGALVPITSFGHSLIHGALDKASDMGIMGLLMGMFDLTASGITAAIVFTFIFSLFFRPQN